VPGALDRLRDLVVMIRRLLAGEVVQADGRTLSLSFVPDVPVPIWMSALGPRAMRVAAEVADGVVLNWCTPERVHAALVTIQEGAAAAGRDPTDVTVAVYVRASLGASDEDCMRALRTAAGEYASYPAYARQFALMGLEAEAGRAAAAHAAGRPDEFRHLVRSVALVGAPVAARERLDATGTRTPPRRLSGRRWRPVGSVAGR
jgi:alkanesulfonate monooxygenase SsuD/methylene tetrahydromethanopterin reductase-like flavin-dependent oxidoreductase (luciferase family)